MSKKDEIVIYWSDSSTSKGINDNPLFYPKPKSLFDDMRENKVQRENTGSYFTCPAISNKAKNTFVFKGTMDCEYRYDFSDGKQLISSVNGNYYNFRNDRSQMLSYGPTFLFDLQYHFFSEDSVEAFFTSPYFHEPKYTKYGSVIPGEFNIGNWFRPYLFEIQTWKNKGDIRFEENEPLFYVEFKTNKKVILKRFKINEQLYEYSRKCVDSTHLFGRGQSLLSRYNRFKDVDLDKKVLFEIKNNLLD
jgi:hypothetical protein